VRYKGLVLGAWGIGVPRFEIAVETFRQMDYIEDAFKIMAFKHLQNKRLKIA